jgi:putative methionine-R-sulfoxide reductase with GAF domain
LEFVCALADLSAAREIVTDEKNKPGLDEQAFEKLLEAAYVLQEHNREMRQMEESLELQSERLRQQEAEDHAALEKGVRGVEKSSPANSDYTLTLAEIVEAQHQIQIRHLETDQAMAVVAERIARITNASGAAIGILDGKTIRYRAGAGAPALPLGSEVPLATAICATCVRTGQVLRTPDVNTEFLFDPELCRQRNIESLCAVPVYHDGSIVGALELYFDRLQGFAEQDIHTCQLMAGLVTEAIGRGTESALKKSMAAERSSMLAAIERLKPNLAALAGDQASASSATNNARETGTTEGYVCWKCGDKLVAQEQFCGKCGAPRLEESEQSSLQSKIASALRAHEQGDQASAYSSNGHKLPRTNGLPYTAEEEDQLARLFASAGRHENAPSETEIAVAGADEEAIKLLSLSSTALQRRDGGRALESASTKLIESPQKDITWSSAAKAREFLETLAATSTPSALARFWRARRGDVYLAIAIILVFVVIRWGILSGDSVGATGHGTPISGNAIRHKTPTPDADLSMFDRLMIGLGLAEAPQTPEYKGNPELQVWIDPHTALYYCPGSDLYGKTPKGKFASQRDAQLDQFEPASRRVCD